MAIISVEESEWEKMEQRIKELEAELKAISVDIIEVTELETDGERLDFMQKHEVHIHHLYGTDGHKWEVDWRAETDVDDTSEGDTLRQAIDKARKGE